MRFLLAFFLLVLAGCPSPTDAAGDLHGDDGGAAPECFRDSDCVAAAAKCCDCPTYATPSQEPGVNACAGVMCPISTCPNNVRAACVQSQCQLGCAPMACDASCADGFVVDTNGCLTCECAQVTTRECTAANDCTRVPADCCGCARGGADTAVVINDVDAQQLGLSCPQNPSCPAGNVCANDLGPTCVQGACDLAPADPAGACGRADLPACPSGQICTVNTDSAATTLAVGVCVPVT